MKQSVPWSVKGVETDARETAKELARRSGMTLGQWLNAMISEQTAEAAEGASEAVPAPTGSVHGSHESARGDIGRTPRLSPLDALAERLEGMNRRSTDTARAPKSEEHREFEAGLALERLRETELRTAGLLETLVQRNEEAETRTARLIETLARANRETESKTAGALAAVARWIEAAERAPKAEAGKVDRQTSEAIKRVAARLDQIEARLPHDEAT